MAKQKKIKVTGLKRYFIKKGSKKLTKRREVGTRNLLTAFGVIQGKASKSGPGRPRGTYKYGMPIHTYKRLQAERKANYQRYKEEQLMQFQRRGITPEQLQQLKLRQAIEQGIPQIQAVQKGDEPERMVDEDLRFRRWEAEKTLSPSAQNILTRLRQVQNKGKLDNIRMQRRLEERRIINEKANLMKAHENMINVDMDFTGVPQDNILLAKNVFKEIPGNQIMRTNRPNILQTKETGLNLKFF